jgi:Tfp pilus assembly protein PilE
LNTTPREKSTTPGASERSRAPGRTTSDIPRPTRIEWLATKQRGYTLVELLIWAAIYAAAAAAVVGAFWMAINWVSNTWETKAGIRKGAFDKNAEYVARDAQAALAATKAKEQHDAAIDAAEAKARSAQSDAATAYEKGKKDGKDEATRIRDRVRSGALVLRDPGAKPCPADVTRQDGASAGAGSGVDGRARAELPATDTGQVLSPETAEWLVDLGNEADEVVKQLRAAQKGWRSCVDLSRSGASK